MVRGCVAFNALLTVAAAQLHHEAPDEPTVTVSLEPPHISSLDPTNLMLLATTPQSTSQCTGSCKTSALSLHNGYRACHGAGQVTWNQMVADSAQAWVDQLVSSNTMYHAPAGSLHHTWDVPAGENLAMGTKGHVNMDVAMQMWYDEWKDCASLPGCTASTGGAVGHFTALVWKGVTQIGCGKGETAQKTFIACRYWSGPSLTHATANMRGGHNSNVGARSCDGLGPAPTPPTPIPPRRRAAPKKRCEDHHLCKPDIDCASFGDKCMVTCPIAARRGWCRLSPEDRPQCVDHPRCQGSSTNCDRFWHLCQLSCDRYAQRGLCKPPVTQSLAAHIVSYARSQEGKSVDRGQCWDLANEAIKHAKAAGFKVGSSPSTYVWSSHTVTYQNAQPGDILQFANYHEKSGMWTQSHHTAVVITSFDSLSGGIQVEQQNPGPVSKAMYHPGSKTAGSLTVYRLSSSSTLLQKAVDTTFTIPAAVDHGRATKFSNKMRADILADGVIHPHVDMTSQLFENEHDAALIGDKENADTTKLFQGEFDDDGLDLDDDLQDDA